MVGLWKTPGLSFPPLCLRHRNNDPKTWGRFPPTSAARTQGSRCHGRGQMLRHSRCPIPATCPQGQGCFYPPACVVQGLPNWQKSLPWPSTPLISGLPSTHCVYRLPSRLMRKGGFFFYTAAVVKKYSLRSVLVWESLWLGLSLNRAQRFVRRPRWNHSLWRAPRATVWLPPPPAETPHVWANSFQPALPYDFTSYSSLSRNSLSNASEKASANIS